MPERPGLTDPLERLKWDYWAKIDGMSKEEAQGKWLKAAIPIMEKNGDKWEHPDKERIDKAYKKCVDE